MSKINADSLRNAIFGFEDGFVSTCGVLFGIATATQSKSIIFITGIITVIVEATSMGLGAYLSEKSSTGMSTKRTMNQSMFDGLVMFLSYTIAGGLAIIPYIIFPIPTSQIISVIISLIGLFLIGYLPQKKSRVGLEILTIGGIAILIGYISGIILKTISIT